MTLSRVPVEDGGVAGGTLQTGQRVGGAIGTALLPGLFYLVLAEDNATHAVAVALGGATAVVVLALVVAVLDRRAGLRRDREEQAARAVGPRRRAGRGAAGAAGRADAGPDACVGPAASDRPRRHRRSSDPRPQTGVVATRSR